MKIRTLLTCILLPLLMVSCRQAREKTIVPIETVLETNLMRHARNVVVENAPYGYLMEVKNPWDSTASLGQFALVKDTMAEVPEGITVIHTPIRSAISFSATQWSVFMRLGEIGKIKGVLEGRYVSDSSMRALLASGVVLDLGTESAADIEHMIEVQPDIMMYSPYFDANHDAFKVTGAVMFPFADYLENTPLGRAEWIRVVGMLAGVEKEADAWFDQIEARYNALSTLCENVETRPTVFSDKAFNGQWYVAGGQSYIARLFKDAGADYVWKDDVSTASFPLDAETILSKAQNAVFWRITNSAAQPINYDVLGRENPIYSLFDAYKNHKVIVCDTQLTGYFEQSQCEPDLLLADFIHFFHPEVMTGEWEGYKPKYYHWLAE